MKRTRKILALLLIASMAFSVFHPIGVYAVTQEIERIVAENIQQITNNVQQSQGETQQTATGNTTEFAGGSGTEEDPYLISNKTHLNNVRNYLDAHYKLLCDIEFEEADFAEGGAFYNDGAGFEPIGSGDASAFTGVFDGNHYTIKNLYINITFIPETATHVYAGLFGYNNGIIKNIGVLDGIIGATVTSTSYLTSSYAYAGGIAGYNSGTIENSYNTGSVSATVTSSYADAYVGGIAGYNNDGTIKNCYNTGAVSASATSTSSDVDPSAYAYAGGIAGYNNDGTISNCYNTGSVSATSTSTSSLSEAYAGGIVGYNYYGTIENCYNTGSVSATSFHAYAGGITGRNYDGSTITNCYNTGAVSVSATSTSTSSSVSAYAGGIAGYNYGTIGNCYNTGTVSATSSSSSAHAGGIVGYNNGGTITNCYYADIISQGVGVGDDTATKCTMEELTQQATFVGFDFENVWTFDETLESHKAPVLKNIKHIDTEENTTEFAGGNGTYFAPYLISTKMHLDNVRKYLGAHFKLVDDIEFEEADFAEGGAFYNDGAGFMPIGSGDASAFTGVFDGNHYAIKNLYINITSDTTVYAGLFGYNNGTIKNLGVVGGNITASSTSTDAYAYAGGIAGYNNGTIENCHNTGSVGGSSNAGGIAGSNCRTIEYCYNAGSISGSDEAGGIAGFNSGTIGNCYNTGSVGGSYLSGGIAGYNYYGTIENCYNTGTVSVISSSSYDCACTGGIAGDNYYGTIENCYNTGTVNATLSSFTAYVGGIAGFNYGTITNCYYADIISQGVGLGDDTATKCTMGELTQQVTFVGFDFENVWTFDETLESHKAPVLKNIKHIEKETEGNTTEFAGGSGTEEDPYLISNKTHLNNVRNYLGAHFKLINDIEFEETDFAEGGAFYNDGAGFEPIGSGDASAFTGVFDGNHYTIKNLYINITSNRTVYAGLFGYNNGTIKNLGVVGGNITASSTSTSTDAFVYAGGIAGNNEGMITNCYNTGAVSATATSTPTSTYADAYAGAYAGGIAGENSGTIENCYNTGAVSATSTSTSIYADASAYACAGGIAGYNYGTIENCYNTGAVSATASSTSSSTYAGAYASAYAGGIAGENYGTIENCYNTGTVSATSTTSHAYAGGITGRNYNGTITNCYNTGAVSATSSSTYAGAYAGGIAGEKYGTIENCYNTGTVRATSSSTYADAYAGGVVGDNKGTITNCYNTGAVSATSTSTSSYAYAGGIAGLNYETIENCYNTGTVSATSSYYAYAGGIAGSNYSQATITNCYYADISSKGVGYGTDTATKCTFEEMMQQATFVGFDFENTWFIDDGDYKFPQLKDNAHFEVLSIEITKLPDKLTYIEGQNLDITGMVISALCRDDEVEFNAEVSGCEIIGDTSTPGTKTITVAYGGKTVTFNVTVTAKTLRSIDVTTKPTKLTYLEGDAFSTTGMVVTAYYNNNTSAVITGYTVSGYTSTPGTNTITITYGGKTATFNVTVNAKTLTSIAVTTKPTKLTYLEGDAFDKTGMVVTAYYNNNTSAVITDYTVSGYTSTPGTKTITVSYGGKTATFDITVKSRVPSAVTSSTHTVSGGTISKIKAGTTAAELLANLAEGQYCKVYKGNVEVSPNTAVGTGMVVKIMDGNTEKASYTVVVTGDTNGDGNISVTDMISIKAHILKKTLLTGVYATAADTNGDSGISITDFIQIKAKILGKGSITER